MADQEPYFTVEPTSLTIPKRGALAIFAGDRPKDMGNGAKSYSLRGPFLIIPQEMWEGEAELAAKVAQVLNENAHLFFDSAKDANTEDQAPPAFDVDDPISEIAPIAGGEHG